MSQSHRGHFGASSLFAFLALTAGSAAADALPPLRIDPALLGAGTPPPSSASGSSVTAKSPLTLTEPALVAPSLSPRIAEQPQTPAGEAPAPTSATAPEQKLLASDASKATAQLPPVSSRRNGSATSPSPSTPSQVPAANAAEAPRRQEESAEISPQQTVVPLPAIARPEEPPLVVERPALPPLYSAHVAAGDLPEPRLTSSTDILPHFTLPNEVLPTFIAAEHISGKTDVQVVADGDVEIRKRNSILKSDRVTYWQETDEVEAEGNVRLSRDGDRVRGPRMRMKMKDSTGFFEQPEYNIRRNKTGSVPTLWIDADGPHNPDLTTAQGAATRMEFEGEGKYRLSDATYSTCAPAAGHDPDWFARTADLRLDYDEQQGTAKNATLYFKGVPILYSPWLSFSLNNERKSGLLSPTFGSTSSGGFEYTQPFYWNIAQNMDATIAPRIMAKRGTLWKGEYRYLQTAYSGTMQGEYLPDDKLKDKSRSSYSLTHNHSLGYGFSASLVLNGASDDTYFSDLANGSTAVAQTNLLRQGTLSYGGTWWSANLMAQSYQTLQDPSLPRVTEPYRRLPQLTVNANRGDLPLGLNFAFSGEHVNFRNPTLVEGRRFTLYPQISLPLQTEVLSVTPKIGLHSTRYQLDHQAAGTPDRLSRNVPIFSLDSGVTFERDIDWLGDKLTQTLEPRLYYLYVPVRDQSQIPVFDTGISGFDFAQIFGENRYAGGDRIGDANQATLMLTSRLLDPATGAESIRAAFGQRFYFSTQKVGLPGEVLRSDRQTDFLGSLSGRVLPKTYADAGVQYNPRLGRMERLNIGGRYQPESGKVLNAGYRYTRDQLGQIDISGQWPLTGGWHAVGRFNYSTKEGRMIESVAGLEFDGGCWIGRIVMQRLATQTQSSNTALFFQLELNDFAKIGSNPLDILKRNVPGYDVINQRGADASTNTQ
ncbi:MAG: LPS assembly protein LptD [Sulfuritalea sp.]|nr:LPS assembly protein LptD [Sulfuritalea sp.]